MEESIWRAYRTLNTLKWVLTGMIKPDYEFQKDDIYQLLVMTNEIEKDLYKAISSGDVETVGNGQCTDAHD